MLHPFQPCDVDAVLDQIARGHRDAFRQIVRAYSLPLRSYIAGQVHYMNDVDDLVQEVFIAAYRNLGAFRRGEDLGAWLRGIAWHKQHSHWRSSARGNRALEWLREELARVVESDLDRAASEHSDAIEMMDGLWEPPRDPGYAVELWFLPEAIAHAALVSLIAPKDATHHLSLVELTSRNRLALFPPASVRFLYRWPTGRDGGENLFSDDIYVPYRWHHLVAQVDGDRMELFVDGARASSLPLGPQSSTAPCQVLLGG